MALLPRRCPGGPFSSVGQTSRFYLSSAGVGDGLPTMRI